MLAEMSFCPRARVTGGVEDVAAFPVWSGMLRKYSLLEKAPARSYGIAMAFRVQYFLDVANRPGLA
jgi:hypothetical protein